MSHENTCDLDRLLVPIRSGDHDAFADWVRAASPKLRRCLRPFAATLDTESIVQDTLLRLWRRAGALVSDGRPNMLLRFAVRTARNLAIDRTRRSRRMISVEDPERVPGVPAPDCTALVDPALRRILLSAIEKLPPRPKAALQARLDRPSGSPDSTLAARVGMRPNTFVQNIVRARRLVATHLAACGVDPSLYLAA